MGEWHEQSRVSFRDRLTARTPRSERGGRGSNPCSGAPHGRVAQFAVSACLTNKRLLVRIQPRPLLCGRSSAAVERSPETRCGAGLSPAGHIQRLRSSTRQSCRLLIGGLQVRGLPGPLWKDCHRRGIPSRKRVRLRPSGVRLPLLPLYRSGEVERVRRATVNREEQVRALPPELIPLLEVGVRGGTAR